jgi:hypothetical protein
MPPVMDLARLAGGVLVRPTGAPPPVAFAADELRRYLGRIFERTPDVREVTGPPGAWLALSAEHDVAPAGILRPGEEHAAREAGASWQLAGRTPRALVAAVYAALGHVGCEWSPHGVDAEHVPAAEDARRAPPTFAARPAFARRAWASDLGTWHLGVPDRIAARLPDDVAFVDWIAKTGGTGFQFIRHANDTTWEVAALVPELERRGLAVERGGHVLAELLPRETFAAHPEWFPASRDGMRSDFGNVCGASKEALAWIRDGAAHAAGGTDFHVWGLDVFGGGWCACPACAPLTPADQALRVVNAVAEGLPDGTRAFHLVYHDTLHAPRAVRPAPRVWAEFAPRERCYMHALDEPDCETNRFYREVLERHLVLFDGRVEAFEYYGDAILFGGCAVPLVDVVARDLDFYRRVGVRGIACLTFGTFSLLAYGVNLEAFARGVHHPASAREGRAAHARRLAGADVSAVSAYLAALEALIAGVVRHGDVLLPPRDAAAARRTRTGIAAAVTGAPAVRTGLLSAPAPHRNRVEAELALLDYTTAVLTALGAWLDAGATVSAADAVRAVFDDARARLQAVTGPRSGTFAAHDLEVIHFAVAGMLTWPEDPVPRPFLGRS